MRKLMLVFVVLVLSSCTRPHSILETLDLWGFKMLGRAVLSETDMVKIKEVHLNNAVLLGHAVIVSGELQEIGDHSTYLVLMDSSARLVVDLTALPPEERDMLVTKGEARERLRVMGVVGFSSKGYPHVLAKAVRFSADDRRSI